MTRRPKIMLSIDILQNIEALTHNVEGINCKINKQNNTREARPVKGSIIGISNGYDNGNKYIFFSQQFFQSRYSCMRAVNPFPDCL